MFQEFGYLMYEQAILKLCRVYERLWLNSGTFAGYAMRPKLEYR